jgi:hypothetical protein
MGTSPRPTFQTVAVSVPAELARVAPARVVPHLALTGRAVDPIGVFVAALVDADDLQLDQATRECSHRASTSSRGRDGGLTWLPLPALARA